MTTEHLCSPHLDLKNYSCSSLLSRCNCKQRKLFVNRGWVKSSRI